MAITENALELLGRSSDSIFHKESVTRGQKRFKVLVISENSSDIYMVKKLLSDENNYITHEAATLPAALKVINYLTLDLIIVDDRLSTIDGYEVVEKLNRLEVSQDIPKLILLTTDYKTEKKESFSCKNVDFVKKPLDSVLFKLRVKSLIEHSQKGKNSSGYFKQLALQKFEEAQNHMALYQEIFETNENMMALYDAKKDKIVESNQLFEKFFLPLHSLNRIMESAKLARKFVPFIDEVNYLNYYHPSEWMQTLIQGSEFSYLVKLQRDFKEYSFNILVKKVVSVSDDIYLLRFSNIYDYLPQHTTVKTDAKMPLKERNLDAFKEDFLQLRQALWEGKIRDDSIDTLLYSLSTKLSILCEDASIVKERSSQERVDIYFLLVGLLKEKFLNRNIYLNAKKVDVNLNESSTPLYLALDADAIKDLVFGLLNNYYGNYFNTSMQDKRLDINLIQEETLLKIELILDARDVDEQATSFFEKIVSKNEAQSDAKITDALPKNVKQSLEQLNAHISKIQEEDKSLFTITIPLD